jgi:CheY-like chemotaxis protein
MIVQWHDLPCQSAFDHVATNGPATSEDLFADGWLTVMVEDSLGHLPRPLPLEHVDCHEEEFCFEASEAQLCVNEVCEAEDVDHNPDRQMRLWDCEDSQPSDGEVEPLSVLEPDELGDCQGEQPYESIGNSISDSLPVCVEPENQPATEPETAECGNSLAVPPLESDSDEAAQADPPQCELSADFHLPLQAESEVEPAVLNLQELTTGSEDPSVFEEQPSSFQQELEEQTESVVVEPLESLDTDAISLADAEAPPLTANESCNVGSDAVTTNEVLEHASLIAMCPIDEVKEPVGSDTEHSQVAWEIENDSLAEDVQTPAPAPPSPACETSWIEECDLNAFSQVKQDLVWRAAAQFDEITRFDHSNGAGHVPPAMSDEIQHEVPHAANAGSPSEFMLLQAVQNLMRELTEEKQQHAGQESVEAQQHQLQGEVQWEEEDDSLNASDLEPAEDNCAPVVGWADECETEEETLSGSDASTVPDPSPVQSVANTLANDPDSGKPRIMVVEPRELLGELLSLCLRQANYDVVWCRDAEVAGQQFCSTNPDLVLISASLQQQSGWQLARQLRKLQGGEQRPITVLTDKGSVGEHLIASVCGVSRLIIRPFDPVAIVADVDAALRGTQASSNQAGAVATSQ